MFLPDPYSGWTVKQLKERCRELGHALMRDEMIILALAAGDVLPKEYQERVDLLKIAYEA